MFAPARAKGPVLLAFLILSSTARAALPAPELLKDPSPQVRLRAALARAEARDAEAIPVLIDLLAEFPAAQRQPIEELLTQLAGEWAPVVRLGADDRIARKIRRDAWAAWWSNTGSAALLDALREHTPTEETRRQVRSDLTQLGSEDFGQREAAMRALFTRGRVALPQLREAVNNRDAEVASRVRRLIERIEREPTHHLPAAAVRLLALRRPDGAAEALLAYLPHAEDDNLIEEVQQALAVLARREDKPEPALRRALDDPRPAVRATAAEALIRGSPAARAAARSLLRDKEPAVRLRVALALAAAGKEGVAVPVLIDLLAVLPDEQAGQVESALYQLAGDSAPKETLGSAAEQRRKCREAWAAWWKANANRVEWDRLQEQPQLGYTVLCDTTQNRVYEIDRGGKLRWSIANVMLPADAWVLPGNRVLIAEHSANRVTERDFTGKILWEKQVPQPVSVQRLPNGHTFILSDGGAAQEVDRDGKEIYTIRKMPGGVRAAYRLRTGPIVCLTNQGECVLMNENGTRLRSFPTNHTPGDIGGIDLTPTGRILVTPQQHQKVIEYDTAGRKILELDAPQAATATPLPNGHVLVASYQAHRVYELDRTGKVVWEYKNAGHVYRARRR